MSVKQVAKLVTLVGNCSVWNMVFNLTVKCHPIRPLEEVMMLSIPFSLKPVLVSMFLDVSSLIRNQLLSMKLELVLTDSYSTLNN